MERQRQLLQALTRRLLWPHVRGRSNHLPWSSRIDTSEQVAGLIQTAFLPGVPTW
jgi:hypothetical protein